MHAIFGLKHVLSTFQETVWSHLKHLVKFAKRLPNGKYRWRFASHPRFSYWALDMKQRHQLLSQSNVYLHQHPTDANMTIEELREMVNSMSGKQMVHQLQRYVSKVQGTNPYSYQRLQELLALIEQKGCPTFFFTFSAADSYWPELQRLLQNEEDATRSERGQAVIDNPHLTYCFLSSISMTLSGIGCMVFWMQTGVGFDLNIKPGEVFMRTGMQS